MMTPTLLLLSIGALGAVDIAWFHSWRGRLVFREETRREAWIHVARGLCYATQFLVVPHVRFTGAALLLLVALFVVDVAIAAADVLEEPRSRASQGGLAPGEYLMHIALSVLVGAFLYALFSAAAPGWREPFGIHVVRQVPAWLSACAVCMAVGSAGVAVIEALALVGASLKRPAPLHVRVRVRASREQLWNLTQDHRLHPDWDGRFTSIEMLHEDDGPRHDAPLGVPDPRIGQGTLMRYARRLCGMTIHGFGRYKHHRPMRQSTFEFWSDDPRSLIRRGVGLWLYRDVEGGRAELSTSFTYEVRWGPWGRLVDRLLFRPLFQWYTERSFRRLAQRWFDEPKPRVLGRRGRRPQVFPREASAA